MPISLGKGIREMSLLIQGELKKLIEERGMCCLSIYMPTHRTAPESKQDPIRFKNILREAEQRLKTNGLCVADTRRLLKPAKSLLKNSIFWQYQTDGLAVFISPDFFHLYHFPIVFQELLVITDRFHLKPLLSVFSHDGQFYVLALSQNEVRLFQCTRSSCHQVELEGVPRNLAETLKYDVPEKQLQFHTRTPPGTGQRAAMFHGHGAGIDDAKVNVLRYFNEIDHGLQNLLREEKAPVVLAGVEYLLPIYKEANTFLNLMEKGITGNPEGVKPQDLHKQAWEIVEPYFLKTQEKAAERYRQFVGSERASKDLKVIVPAAYEGRVDLLFVAVGIQYWGSFHPHTHAVDLHQEAEPGDEDLLDFAAIHTLLHGGIVFAVEPQEVPDEASIAALFRY
jgi:hypothetical protein